MELSLQQRIDARLARYRQEQAAITGGSLNSGRLQSQIGQTSLYQDQLTGGTVDVSGVTSSGNPVQVTQRELATTRTRVLQLERQTVGIEEELRGKEAALRRTVSEAAGEREALVQALGVARGEVEKLRLEAERREEAMSRQEARLAQLVSSCTELQQKYSQMQTKSQEEVYKQKALQEAHQILEAKLSIAEAEVKKLEAETEELRGAALEGRLAQQKTAALEHEYGSLGKKYRAECENNVSVRAELVQVKQEYAKVASELLGAKERVQELEGLGQRFQEQSQQNKLLQRQVLELQEQFEEGVERFGQNKEQSAAEEAAIHAMAVQFKAVYSGQESTVQGAPGIQNTLAYNTLAPALFKARQQAELLRQVQGDYNQAQETLSAQRKRLQELQSTAEELQIRCETLEAAQERTRRAGDAAAQEIASLKQQVQNKEQLCVKLTCDTELAVQQIMNTVTGAGFIPQGQTQEATTFFLAQQQKTDITGAAQAVQACVAKLRRDKQEADAEADALGQQCNSLQEANKAMAQQQRDLQRELEDTKALTTKYSQTSTSMTQTLGALKTNLAHVSQLAALQLRVINQQDRRVDLLRQQSTIGNLLVSNYLVEQKQATKPRRSQHLRKVIYAIIFINKLRKTAKVTQEVKALEVKSLQAQTAGAIEQMAQQVTQIVQPVLVQIGDHSGLGLLSLESLKEQRSVVNKALNYFFSQTVVYAFGTDQVNLNCGPFNLVSSYVSKATQEARLSVQNAVFRAEQLDAELRQLRTQLSETQKRLRSAEDLSVARATQLEKIQDEAAELQARKTELEEAHKMAGRLSRDNQDMADRLGQEESRVKTLQNDVQQYQNEIQRLSEALEQSRKIVQQCSNQMDEQQLVESRLRKELEDIKLELQAKTAEAADAARQVQKLQNAATGHHFGQEYHNQQITTLTTQLGQQAKLIQELQSQLEREKRVRSVSENQLARQRELLNTDLSDVPKAVQFAPQPQQPQRQPIPAASQTMTLPPRTATTQSRTGAVGIKSEIRGLIEELNASLNDDF